jgi:hypothetical protein
MRAGSTMAGGVRHVAAIGAQAFLIAAILATLAFAYATATGHAPGGANAVLAKGARDGWIVVGTSANITKSALTTNSHFVASGCGFRANSKDYYLVIHGPAPDTKSLAYWVDPFPVGGDGCGQATPSWSSSGVDGSFDVYVVRSSSGNPWQAQPASNVVTINIVN